MTEKTGFFSGVPALRIRRYFIDITAENMPVILK